MCSPDFDLLRRFGEIQVMNTFIDRALERGIIDDAKEQSALVLEDLVRTFTGKKVLTKFQTAGGKPEMDSSCDLRSRRAGPTTGTKISGNERANSNRHSLMMQEERR